MFAVLGAIVFEVIGSPQRFESIRAYDFAEQRVIEAPPRLQWLANELERLRIDMLFHVSIADPAAQLAVLNAAADAHQALPLVFGNGQFYGLFVIESLTTGSIQLSSEGDPVAITVKAALKEWIADASSVSAATIPASPPIAIAVTPAGGAGSSSASTLRSAGSISGAGLSALLNVPAPSGPGGPFLQPEDVSTAVITRSVAL